MNYLFGDFSKFNAILLNNPTIYTYKHASVRRARAIMDESVEALRLFVGSPLRI